MVDEGEIRDLIADRPALENGLEALLAADETRETWDFDDVDLETGTFGELASHDVVEEVDDGYRLRDPGAVRAALDGDADSVASGSETESRDGFTSDVSVSAVTGRRIVVGLGLLLAFVVPRAIPYSKVFRDGRVVLTANDPYFYRYSVDQLLAQSRSPFGFGALVGPPLSEHGEPLLVATLWWVSTLFGGSREVAGVVLAVYPVVAALGIGALVYVLGTHVIGDRRIGVVAASLLAITPAHAMRTSVGFADHHAFDYLWLMAVVTALAWLVTRDDLTARRTRYGAFVLGVAVAALTLSWNGSPLVLLPVAGYLAVIVPVDVDEGRSPITANAPTLTALVVGAALSLGANVAVGWQRPTVAAAPALLAAGGLGLAGGGELFRRRGLPVRRLVGLEIGLPVVGILSAGVLVDGLVGQLLGGIGFLLGTSGIGETASAFGPGQLLGLKLFGFLAVLALPFLLWAGKRALLGDRRWLVLSAFGWSLLVLSVFQLRFAGQLSPIVALFAALTVVWALARVGLAATPTPLRSADDGGSASSTDGFDVRSWFDADALSVRSGSVAVLLVVALIGPSLAFLPSQVSGSAVDDPTYETATWMAQYADERGWTYPDSYVFSDWPVSRVYNYPVNGFARNYTFARGNYSAFISASDPSPWYDRLRDRVGFVVLEPLPPRSNTVQQHLYNTYGSRWMTSGGEARYEAVSHYRAVFTTEGGAHKVFTLVPGARLVGEAPPNATVAVRTTVTIPNAEFTYRKRVTASRSGEYRAVVPYPGEYTVEVGGRTTAVTVPESAVRNGTQVAVSG